MAIYEEPESWIKASIDSIINQSYKQFEFIIINDNPKRPRNKQILYEYCKIDQRILVIHNKKNIGLTKSLNLGIKTARGDYIARMDSDDISNPERFLEQITYLENNEKTVVCGTFATFINDTGKIKRRIQSQYSRNDDIKGRLLISSSLIHPSVMIRKSVLDKNNILYNESFQYSQDYKLWVELSQHGDFHNLSNPLLMYRISERQVSSQRRNEQALLAKNIRQSYIKVYENGNIHTLINSGAVDLEFTKKILAQQPKDNFVFLLLYLSLNRYGAKEFIYYLFSFRWFSLKLQENLMIAKRFLKKIEPLV